MTRKYSRILALAALAVAATAAHAGPFSDGVASATKDTTSIVQAVGAVLGGVITLIGGGITAWKASHGEPFTKQLVFAIVGVAIAAVCIIA